MDQNLKKKIAIVKGLIQKKQYVQALSQLQVLMYKYQKAYQIHLMLGLCYQKLNKEIDAQKAYKQVIQLKQDQPNAIKALCDIYTKRGDIKNATLFLQRNLQVLKKIDDKKARQALVKLVQIYKKDQNLQKIHTIFVQYVQKQDKIGDDFVKIASAYFKVSTDSKSFNLQKFQLMGFKQETPRQVQMSAREGLNILLIDVINYLVAVSKQYDLTQKDIANSLYQMKYYFPYSPCMLMLLLLDQYCVGHVGFSSIILQEIYKLLTSYYKKLPNGYLNMQFTQPQIFTVSMVLGYQYLAFFKQFFVLDPCFQEYFEDLALKQQQFFKTFKVRDDYSKKINNFILKKCRILNKISQTKNVQSELEDMKKRIQLLQGSFLEEVIAKMAMNCFVNYQKLDDMKNMLKTRIKNLQEGDMVPHLYKYYFDYLLKIARIYKCLDEQINIYNAVQYINKHDPNDIKYMIEGIWLKFSKSTQLNQEQQKIKIAKQSIQNIQNYLNQSNPSLKSQALRKIAILKIFIGDYNIQSQLKQAILLDRSFSNLQCMGFYLYYTGKFQESLKYMKQAFILNQTHYHTNRLIFILMQKLNMKNEAIDFLQRIKEGFRSVFWINYVLALKYMNLKKYQQAQSYLNAAIQYFMAGVNRKFKFSYQKTIQHSKFAFVYMIQQNDISILFDQIVFPQNQIFQQLNFVSHEYFHIQTKKTQIRLFCQIAEILKVLGRTKSSMNFLNDAYLFSLSLSQQQKAITGQRFQLCLMLKQYATLLFYMRMFKESQSTLYSSYLLCKEQIQNQKDQKKLNLIKDLQVQIKSLFFQISVQRLAVMMKFQSHQTVQLYLKNFSVAQPLKSSVNYLKGKYQFHILEYLQKRDNISLIQKSIQNYLNFFNLGLNKLSSVQFQNKYFDFDTDKRKMIRQSLQDYYIIKYISNPQKLNQKQIMSLIQIFPRSTIFYIIFGMSTNDLKLKTASFLKCIQLDKQSPISIDLLASLYLKQKNYLAATKLFLKSLQMDILNSKCYLGLAICLFCIIGNSISIKDQEVFKIIHKALIRINSYMQYLRTVDPSENYHLLNFLKLLVTDQSHSTFQIKTILQSSKKNCRFKYKNTLIYNLLEQATKQWKNFNIWQNESQIKILDQFLSKFYKTKPQKVHEKCYQMANQILRNSKQQFKHNITGINLKKAQFIEKETTKLLHQISVSITLACKDKYQQKYFDQTLQLLILIQKSLERAIIYCQQSSSLVIKIKSYLYEYLIINDKYKQEKNKINQFFYDLKSYDHFSKYSDKISSFQSQLFKQILLNPNSQKLKKLLTSHLVVNGGKKVQKGKHDYKIQLLSNTHQNLVVQKQTLKKLVLLYRDQSSWIAYISLCWNQPNQKNKQNLIKWLKILSKLQKKSQSSQKKSQQNINNLLKIKILKIEIYSYFQSHFGENKQQLKKIELNFTSEQLKKIDLLIALSNFYKQKRSQHLLKIKQLFLKQKSPLESKVTAYPLLQLLSFITNKYVYNKQTQQFLIQFCQLFKQSSIQHIYSHLLLMRYLYILQRSIKTQQDLIQQIIDLQKIINQCQNTKISQNTIIILKCSKCLFSADYQSMQYLLDIASKRKILTYSDQVFINFYEIMKLYKQVQINPNKDGVIQQFAIYIDNMIMIVNDQYYQGFFYSLKAIVNSIIVPEQSFVKDRNLRMSMLLSPYATKSFISNQS